ncbi:MAG: cytochrome P450 [Myxococcota bacterium]
MEANPRQSGLPTQVSELPVLAENPGELPENERPWDRYARAKHDAPVFRFGGAVVVRNLEAIKAVLADRSFQQGARKAMELMPGLDPRFVARRKKSLLLRDGPDHLRMRRIASKSSFSPKKSDRYRPMMQSIMERLTDGVPADGACDAVSVLTHDYPTRVIIHVLGGAESDTEMFSALVETVLDAMTGVPAAVEEALVAHEQLDAFILDLIEEKRTSPGADLITDLVQAETEEGTLSAEEVLNTAVSVITAGTDTTRNQLAIGLHLFADHPAQWEALADESSLEAAAHEILRYSPLAHVLLRTSDENARVAGVDVPAGTMLVLDIGGAQRDPAVYDDPNTFDLGRPEPVDHLGLGFGHKYCLGASLATAEIVEALRVLRRRFASIEHAGVTRWKRAGFVNGPLELPLRLTSPER